MTMYVCTRVIQVPIFRPSWMKSIKSREEKKREWVEDKNKVEGFGYSWGTRGEETRKGERDVQIKKKVVLVLIKQDTFPFTLVQISISRTHPIS